MTEQIPGDGIDNDGDGLVDEEYCGFLWQGKTYSWNYDIFSRSASNKPHNTDVEIEPAVICHV